MRREGSVGCVSSGNGANAGFGLRTARDLRRWARGAALVLCLGFCAVGWAQQGMQPSARDPRNVDATTLGGPVDLGPQWLAQVGDDPRWAEPGLDDSRWRVMNTDIPLSQQGLKRVDGIWYRMHVHLPAGAHDLALVLRNFMGSEQVFVNGDRLDSVGFPKSELRFITVRYIPIPNSALAGHNSLTIAIRARLGRIQEVIASAGGLGNTSVVLLGPADVLSEYSTLYYFRNFTSNTTNLTMTALLLLIALALAFTSRSEGEYAALAVMLTAGLLQQGVEIWRWIYSSPFGPGYFLFEGASTAVYSIALMEFVRLVLGLRRTRTLVVYYGVLAGFNVLANFTIFYSASLISFGKLLVVFSIAGQLLSLPVDAGLPLLALWVFWRRHNRDALLLFFPLLIDSSVRYWNFGIFILSRLHLIQIDQLPMTPIRGFYVQWSELAGFLFYVTLLIFLVLRTIRIARERAASASEMQAVKTLQGLLLARASQATPGYAVETVYRPAAEVGGDFFLVSPGPDGSIVAIVGDVSGKGLLAAMRVSLILGALNRESSRTPADVLNRLNQVLLSQGDVGFTTACCVRVEANGDFSFANAGHLNPYVDGREIESPGALPLGIRAEQTYATMTGHLDAGQRMVLLSDGVPEARAKRELLGFEKLVELTRLRAAEIADAAQQFGQEDDITVLALALA
jgi:hypothetical protein